MPLALVTAPAQLPLALDELKEYLRIDGENEDAQLLALLRAVTEVVETRTRRALITQTWDWKIPDFAAELVVPKPPLQSITSISYRDTAGATQTVAASVYEVDAASVPGRVREATNQSWPTVGDVYNAVTVRLVAGYGATWNDVPPPLRLAIAAMVAHFYEHREPVITGTIVAKIPNHLDMLLWPYRVGGLD